MVRRCNLKKSLNVKITVKLKPQICHRGHLTHNEGSQEDIALLKTKTFGSHCLSTMLHLIYV